MSYTHFAWPVSPYSAKTRAYLQFKQLAFEEKAPTVPGLMFRIKRAVGRPVMPTVLCPDGTWLQDSSVIIDTLEAAHPDFPVVPESPTQRLACMLLELHADEWFPTVIMHTRWNTPTNAKFAISEFARCGMPWLPGPIAKKIVAPLAGKMASYRPVLGVTPQTAPGIERFLRETIETLQNHFCEHAFLFGTRPSLADFALFGPLWAHVYRDPGSRHYFDAAPALVDWMERLQKRPQDPGAFLPDDEVPATLDPLFERFFGEHFPFLRSLVTAIDAYFETRPDQVHVPRSLGDASFSIGGVDGTRRWLTFGQWMFQRSHEVCDQHCESEALRAWLASVGGSELLDTDIQHPFEMHHYKVRRRQS